MAMTLVKNADRMMLAAVPLEEGIELTFADGRTGLIPFRDLPEILSGGGLASLELPNPYEVVVTMAGGDRTEIPWDFRPPLLRPIVPAPGGGRCPAG